MATQKLASAAYFTLASAPFLAFGRLGGCGENELVYNDTKTERHKVSVRHYPLWTTIRVQRRHVLEKWQTVETFRYFRYTNHVYPKADALDLALKQQATLHKTEMLKLSGFKKKILHSEKMQQLVEQLREISSDRADHCYRNGKLVHSTLRRCLLMLGSEGYKGRNSGSANLWLLIKLLGKQPKLAGNEWPGAQLVFPRGALLGQGSFAQVYECKNYALKCLNGKLSWEREISVLQALVHPNLVRLEDWWLCSGQQVLLLERAPGIQLRSYYGKCSAGELPAMGSQLFSALAYIHRQGYVHRDIKPSNLMWDPKSVKLTVLDLGVARKTETVKSWSGSLAFTLPKVYRHRQRLNRQLLEANDVWACVASLWSVLLGRSPYHGIKNSDELKELFIRKDSEILAMLKWSCPHTWLQSKITALADQHSAQQTWQEWIEFIFPQNSEGKSGAVPDKSSAQAALDQR